MSQEKCPGTSSEKAGISEACAGCPNASYCQQEKIIDPDIDKIKQNMSEIKNTIAIMSGKGGVGKSTFTRNIAETMSKKNHKTIILDFDLCGPSIPKLTKTEDVLVFESNGRLFPIKISENLYCISIGHFYNESTEIFSSSFKTNIIKKILIETDFSGFDFLFIDTPPGVTDEHLGIINYIEVDSVILVTTPQMISFNDVKRQIDFCKKTRLEIFGIVENMKKYICKECCHENYIFKGCGVENYCAENGIEYLGECNINTDIAMKSDSGEYVSDKLFDTVVEKLIVKYKIE